MIPKFNAENLKVELAPSTIVENEEQINDYYAYLKNIGGEMGQITGEDLKPFYYLMNIPQRFKKESLNSLFSLLEQPASSERFYSADIARECIGMIETYRTEMDI